VSVIFNHADENIYLTGEAAFFMVSVTWSFFTVSVRHERDLGVSNCFNFNNNLGDIMNEYDKYNREERYICSHLFRLLHENIDKKDGPLGELLLLLSKRDLNGKKLNFDNLQFKNVGIYSEVALIRDAYKFLKKNNQEKKFMDDLVDFLFENKGAADIYRKYSELPDALIKTHPEKISWKAKKIDIHFESKNEEEIYGIIQSIFKSKPDLLITIDSYLIVFEAKFTQSFDEKQFNRSSLIAKIWAKLLYEQLGFEKEPDFYVVKLGGKKSDIPWEKILKIADRTYKKKDDRSLIAFKNCVDLIKAGA
jgi:hypothetical protein